MLPVVGVALNEWHGARMGRRKRGPLVGHWFLVAVLLSCRHGWAADEPPPPPEVAPEKSPEAPAAAAPNSSGSPPEPPAAEAPAPPLSPEARQAAASEAFDRAAALYDAGRVAVALAEYERANELVPSLEALYNIGVIDFQLERWAGARRAFEQYLKLGSGEVPPERVAETKGKLDELKAKTGTLTISMNVAPEQVKIDSSPVEVLEISGLVVDPGERVLYVSKPGYRPVEQVVHVARGERTQVLVQLFPDAPPSVRSQIEPFAPVPARVVDRGIDPRWLAWGITGALAVGWGTTAALAIKARHDRNTIEHPGTPAEDIEDAQRLHKTLAIVSDILLASTLTSAGVAAYFTWWADDNGSSTVKPGPNVPAQAGSSRVWSVGVSGRF